MRVLAILWCIMFGILEYYCVVVGGPNSVSLLSMIQMFLMIGMYIVIICMLNMQMRRLKGNFRDEIMSINAQFVVYLFAYFIRASFYFCDFIYQRNIFEDYRGAIFECIEVVFTSAIPPAFVIYQHHRVFKNIESQSYSSTVPQSTVNQTSPLTTDRTSAGTEGLIDSKLSQPDHNKPNELEPSNPSRSESINSFHPVE